MSVTVSANEYVLFRKVAINHLVLVKHLFDRDVRRSAIPVLVIAVLKPDGNDAAHADVGAAPMEHPRPGNSRPMWRLERFMVHGLARNSSILKE